MSIVKKPVVALTIGDPAGVGPEISIATMMDQGVYEECHPFLIAMARLMIGTEPIRNG